MKEKIDQKDVLKFDYLVLGSGVAGMSTALNLAEDGHSVAIITKLDAEESNTRYAQGGIACVIDENDDFSEHIRDTLIAGRNLCNQEVVKKIIENGPQEIKKLIDRGVKFTTRAEVTADDEYLADDVAEDFDLGKEGGHGKRRVLHSGDITGAELVRALLKSCQTTENISIFENHAAIDLITARRSGVTVEKDRCYGAYVFDIENNCVKTFEALATVVATGGAGKVYLYTSNPDCACGSGIAMCYRAGVPIANMEFFQFHPTILYHPKVRSFLISEAVRGEGAVLKRFDACGKLIEFMDKYHELKSLAPRDVVARAIDNEMKISGQECVYLDIRHKSEEELKLRFPNIFQACLDAGVNMSKDLIPVVPAAHYLCGGAKTDEKGATTVSGLYAVGECACTGLHGANRLASNSLLEAVVVARLAADDIISSREQFIKEFDQSIVENWSSGNATDSDEMVVIVHNWEEIRKFMWDYVGIVRTNKRLERAKSRIKNIRKEIEKYYWDFYISKDLIELRNIASVAEIIIDAALKRKESRGLHYNADYIQRDESLDYVESIIVRPVNKL
ncbi:L-aspartate oxidase [Lentisphaerota bacterium WC36G]|nr:L-aspartate oxidase [Lentisphaerae bacterium WC36]